MKKITFLLLLAIMILPFSCQVDDYGRGDGGSSRNGFTLDYSVSNAQAITKASVNPEDGEEKIESFYLLIFDYSTDGSGEFVHAENLSDKVQSMGSAGTINLDFPAETGVTTHDNYVLLFLANSDDYLNKSFDDLKTELTGMTENDAINTFNYNLTGFGVGDETDYDDRVIKQESIPMSARVIKATDEEAVTVKLIRNVCRFDVINQVGGYTLKTVSVWNAYPEIAVWDRSFFTYEKPREKRLYGVRASSDVLSGGLYSFENYSTVPEQDDEVTTCLIIGLQKEGDTDVTYYRANLNSTYLGQQLKRNNVYKTTITNVLGKGAATEEQAWKEREFLLDIDINGWDVDHNGSIQYDGDNILAVPISKMNFTHDKETRELSIFTLGDGTLEISKESLFPGLDISLNKNILTVSVDNSEIDQIGYVELKFGALKSTITITQTGSEEERLVLSQYDVDPFQATTGNGVDHKGPITVTSSDDWIAEIFNGDDVFSFDPSTINYKKEGVSGETFNLYTIKNNTNPNPRYAFVLITLKDNPEMRRVMVLVQKGVGGIEISRNLVSFNPFGKAIEDTDRDYYDVEVKASDGSDQTPLEWEVRTYSGDGFVADKIDSQTLRITATPNTTARELSSVFRIYIENTTTFRELTVTQAVHTITVNPTSIASISRKGGNTPDITVTSTTDWEADIVVKDNVAYFNDNTSSDHITGVSGGKFFVTFPELKTPNVTPVATITISIPGTEVKYEFQVTQDSMDPKRVIANSYASGYWSLADGGRNINVLASYMKNASNFGPNGVVIMPAVYQITNSTTPGNNSNIFQITNNNPNSSQRSTIESWWKEDANILIYTATSSQTNGQAIVRSKTTAYVFGSGNNSNGSVRPYYGTQNKITEYLFNTGPFAKGQTGINFVSYGVGSRTLTSWPSTFTPILMHPNGNCVFGIDPTNRLIFIGNPNLFSTYGTANNNWGNSANVDFLNNVIAFITNAAMYGDDFLNDFK